MSKSEIIFSAGVAGGCISLRGMRQSDGTWLFLNENNESFHEDMLSDEDEEGLVFRQKSDVSKTLEEALKILDGKYEWYRFFPIYIHPEFADVLLSIVRKRCMENPEQRNNLEMWEYLFENPAS